MSFKAIVHTNHSLQINIRTTDPAALHHRLIHGLLAGLQYAVSHPEKQKDFGEQTLPLIELLQALEPSEEQLGKIHSF